MIKVLGDRVLVALPPAESETVSAGGIVLVKDPDLAKTPTKGIVMALGEKVGTVTITRVMDLLIEARDLADKQESGRLDGVCCSNTCDGLLASLRSLKPAPFDVALGDMVLFPASAGDPIRDHGVDYVVLYESEILGICEPLSSEAA